MDKEHRGTACRGRRAWDFPGDGIAVYLRLGRRTGGWLLVVHSYAVDFAAEDPVGLAGAPGGDIRLGHDVLGHRDVSFADSGGSHARLLRLVSTGLSGLRPAQGCPVNRAIPAS